jgi:hypothetical protein
MALCAKCDKDFKPDELFPFENERRCYTCLECSHVTRLHPKALGISCPAQPVNTCDWCGAYLCTFHTKRVSVHVPRMAIPEKGIVKVIVEHEKLCAACETCFDKIVELKKLNQEVPVKL